MQPIRPLYPLVVEGRKSTAKAPGAGTLYINPEAIKLRKYFEAVKAGQNASGSGVASSSNSGRSAADISNSFTPLNGTAKAPTQRSSSSMTTTRQGQSTVQAIVLASSPPEASRQLSDRVLQLQHGRMPIASKAEANLLSQIALDNLLYEIFQQGSVAFIASKLGEAREQFELGITLSSQFGHHLRPEFHFQLAMVFYRLHHWALAFTHIEHGLQHAFTLETQINLLALKGLTLLGQNRFSQSGCDICIGMKFIETAYNLSSRNPLAQRTTLPLLLQAEQRYSLHLHPILH